MTFRTMRFPFERRALIIVALIAACGRSDRRHTTDTTSRQMVAQPANAHVCSSAAGGVVLTEDSIGSLPTHATFGDLKRRCAFGQDSMYDAVGYQSGGWAFPFSGASVLAVVDPQQTVFGDTNTVWMWTAIGLSLRMPDGLPLPATLGEARSRYGKLLVDDNVSGADDVGPPEARVCRYPALSLVLAPKDTSSTVSDSAAVVSVELETKVDNSIRRLCSAASR